MKGRGVLQAKPKQGRGGPLPWPVCRSPPAPALPPLAQPAGLPSPAGPELQGPGCPRQPGSGEPSLRGGLSPGATDPTAPPLPGPPRSKWQQKRVSPAPIQFKGYS